MGLRSIPKQLICLMLGVFAGSSLATTDCPESMSPNILGPCIKQGVSSSSHSGSVTKLRLTNFWMLDTGGIHPPLRLSYLKIERLVMESLWGLRPGESMIGDPRWGDDKRQPDLDAIALLRARETAMAARMVKQN